METKTESKLLIGKNIRFLMKTYGKTRRQVASDLNIKYTTLTDWINGNTYPRMEALERLGEYFRIELKDFFIDIEKNTGNIEYLKTYASKLGVWLQDGEKKMKAEEGKIYILSSKNESKHKTFEERIAEYDNQIEIYEFDWGEPLGDEML